MTIRSSQDPTVLSGSILDDRQETTERTVGDPTARLEAPLLRGPAVTEPTSTTVNGSAPVAVAANPFVFQADVPGVAPAPGANQRWSERAATCAGSQVPLMPLQWESAWCRANARSVSS